MSQSESFDKHLAIPGGIIPVGKPKFVVGDTVMLKSGGFPMTVRSAQPASYVEVDWLDQMGMLHEKSFHPMQLAKAVRMATRKDDGSISISYEIHSDRPLPIDEDAAGQRANHV